MPIPLTSRSSPLGTSRTPSALTMGSSVVIVMAEFCQVIGPLAPRSWPDDEDGQQDHAGEQPDGVPLHLPGLDRSEPATEQLHRGAGAVDDAVDHFSLEIRHHP